ncbi:GNAT family N-acetyltransferase [Chloroflexota bacterium]
MTEFEFFDYQPFTDGEIEVVVKDKVPPDNERGYIPGYEFTIRFSENKKPVGRVNLRIGNTERIIKYIGHIGYGIEEKYRGHHYAAKACRLIKQVALDHGLGTLWIICNPDNNPSRRTCEVLSCELVEIIDLPEDLDMYRRGERQVCRYRWDIG